MKRTKQLLLAALISCGIFGASSAQALVLPDPMARAYQYGDAYSYSLPILANYYDLQFGGGTGPGNPYYVDSAPGSLHDAIVIATGINGGPATTNIAGADHAYETPNSSGVPDFNTGDSEPGQIGTFTGDKTNSWDMRLSSLSTFLGVGEVPIFYFNNNQESSGGATNQNLLLWGQIALVDDQGVLPTRYFDLTNNNGFGGIPGPFSNVAAYTSPGAATATYPQEPTALNGTQKDFILSGGQVCVDNTSGDVVPCGSPNSKAINHNLGANQAAYAAIFPELNALLQQPDFGGYDVMNADFRMRYMNNGYEQAFILGGTVQQGPPVPEPGTMMLLGMGMLGLAVYGKRRLNSK